MPTRARFSPLAVTSGCENLPSFSRSALLMIRFIKITFCEVKVSLTYKIPALIGKVNSLFEVTFFSQKREHLLFPEFLCLNCSSYSDRALFPEIFVLSLSYER
jgi:hypothetical protein